MARLFFWLGFCCPEDFFPAGILNAESVTTRLFEIEREMATDYFVSPHASASRRLHCLRSGAVLETHGQTATKTARSGLRDGRTHSKKDGQTCLFVLCVTIFVGSSSIQVTSSVSVTPVVSRSAQLMWTMIFSERFQRLKTFRVLQRLPLAELRISRATRL